MSAPAISSAMPLPSGVGGKAPAHVRISVGEMLKLIREDWKTHGRHFFSPGFHALAVHRFGAWAMRLPRLPRMLLTPWYRAAFLFVKNFYGIELPWRTTVGRGVQFPHQSGIVINPFATIGDGCMIRHNVTLGRGVRGRKYDSPTLGKDVYVGAGAVIVGAVTIGDGARIGPNAVVMTNVPPGATVVVPPPRIVQPPNRRLSEVLAERRTATRHPEAEGATRELD